MNALKRALDGLLAMLKGWRGVVAVSLATALIMVAIGPTPQQEASVAAQNNPFQYVVGLLSPEGWTAFWTLALFVSTLALWNATKMSVTIANRALTELERPFVVFKVRETGLYVSDLGNVSPRGHGRGILISALENIGRTPAIFIEHADNVLVVPRGQWPPAIDPNAIPIGLAHHSRFPGNFAIGAGQHHELLENMVRKPMDDELWFNFAENNGARDNLFIHGMLRYRDIFDAVYVMGYCAIFDVIQNRFVQMGGADLNYFRKE